MNQIDVHIILSEKDPWIEQCRLFIKDEPVIIHTTDHVDGSIAAARTAGFKMGRAPYVAFVDPDDMVVPGTFQLCADYLDKHPECSGVYTDEILVSPEGVKLLPGWSVDHRPFLQYGYIPELMGNIHHLRVLRREVVEQCFPLKSDRLPEPVLMAELQKYGPLDHIPVIGYQWRIHGKNAFLSFTDSEKDAALKTIRGLR